MQLHSTHDELAVLLQWFALNTCGITLLSWQVAAAVCVQLQHAATHSPVMHLASSQPHQHVSRS